MKLELRKSTFCQMKSDRFWAGFGPPFGPFLTLFDRFFDLFRGGLLIHLPWMSRLLKNRFSNPKNRAPMGFWIKFRARIHVVQGKTKTFLAGSNFWTPQKGALFGTFFDPPFWPFLTPLFLIGFWPLFLNPKKGRFLTTFWHRFWPPFLMLFFWSVFDPFLYFSFFAILIIFWFFHFSQFWSLSDFFLNFVKINKFVTFVKIYVEVRNCEYVDDNSERIGNEINFRKNANGFENWSNIPKTS